MRRFTQQQRYPLAERPVVLLDSSSVSVSSGAVATLVDRSGNGRDFTQATSSKRPAYTANDANFGGQPSMTLDGVDDCLTNGTDYAGGTTATLYTVFKPTGTSADARVYCGRVGAVAETLQLGIAGSGSPTIRTGFVNPVGSGTNKDTSITTGTVSYRYDAVITPSVGAAAIPTAITNGVSGGSYVTTGASNGTGIASSGHAVGSAANGASQFFPGPIVFLAEHGSTHTSGQIATVDEYLRARYQRNQSLPPIMTGLEFFGDLSSPRTSVVSGAVATLGDASGNNRDFTQATSTKRPTYTASDANFGGRPSMTGDGVDDALLIATVFPAPTVATIYIVGTGGNTGRIFVVDTTGGSYIIQRSATIIQHSYFNVATTRKDTTGTTTVWRDASTWNSTSGSDAIPKQYLNGVDQATAYTSTLATGATTTTGSAGIFAATNGLANFSNTTITDILVYSTAHSAGEVAAMDAWLRVRNGLT